MTQVGVVYPKTKPDQLSPRQSNQIRPLVQISKSRKSSASIVRGPCVSRENYHQIYNCANQLAGTRGKAIEGILACKWY